MKIKESICGLRLNGNDSYWLPSGLISAGSAKGNRHYMRLVSDFGSDVASGLTRTSWGRSGERAGE